MFKLVSTLNNMVSTVSQPLIGLRLFRIVQLIVAAVFGISGLGSTAFWTFKYMGDEKFVPFGLSTFRALDWVLSDFVLIFCCFYAAVSTLFNRPDYKRGCLTGAMGFIAQGLLGLYVDSSNSTREQFGVEGLELQPLALNLWFVGWGLLTLWIAFYALPTLAKLDSTVTL